MCIIKMTDALDQEGELDNETLTARGVKRKRVEGMQQNQLKTSLNENILMDLFKVVQT